MFLRSVIALTCYIVLVGASAFSPRIDIFDIQEGPRYEHPFCRKIPCPRYTDIKTTWPNPRSRIYEEAYWIASPIYKTVNGSCLLGEELKSYYETMVLYFKGINKMGLKMDRTLPIRVISRINDRNETLCNLRFFVSYQSLQIEPPAPLSNNIIVGMNERKRCYVRPKRGMYTWNNILEVHRSLGAIVEAAGASANSAEIIADIFSGYGVPNKLKYFEVILCEEGTLN